MSGGLMELVFDSGSTNASSGGSYLMETGSPSGSGVENPAWSASAGDLVKNVSRKVKDIAENGEITAVVGERFDRVSNAVNRFRLKVLKVIDGIGEGIGLAITGIARDYVNTLLGHWKDDATDPTGALPFPFNSALFRASTPFTSSTAPLAGKMVSSGQKRGHSRS